MKSLIEMFNESDTREENVESNLDLCAMKAGERGFGGDFDDDCLPDSWFN